LRRMLLPVGGYQKDEIRKIARELDLPVFDKPDSQEICFVPDGDYAGLVERRRPDLARKGPILDAAGRQIGEHRGQHRFTIGQRRGVGVAFGHPVYVVDKRPESNAIVVGERSEVSACTAGEANWLIDPPRAWRSCWAQHRYGGSPVRARVRVFPASDHATRSGRAGAFRVEFDRPQPAVAPGQALVVYDAEAPDWVIGGGWITAAEGAT